MQEILLPYGRNGMKLLLPEERLKGVFRAPLPPGVPDPVAEVRRALDEPISSLPLEELARGKRNAVIIASDHTRPVPSRVLIPEMLRRLRLNNPSIDITILIATGCHRETTKAELTEKFGEQIVENEKIAVHDSRDETMLKNVGTLPSGGELLLNRIALETDLLISEGFIEPHFFAGFSGGRKSILPGIAARETVLANHCAEFIASPFARTGNLEHNPIHEDMLFAARRAKLAFIVNVVINEKKSIVRALAGHPEAAHARGCEFLSSLCKVKVPVSDIVITTNGGYPLDQNVYQSVKGMTAGEAACREGGVILLAASCSDGHGGEGFFRMLKEMRSPQELLDCFSAVGRNETVPDQWEAQILARIMAKHHVILVTHDCPHSLLEEMHLKAASSMEEALRLAETLTGKDSTISVIPDGVSVIVEGV